MSLWYIPQAADYFSVVKVPMDMLYIYVYLCVIYESMVYPAGPGLLQCRSGADGYVIYMYICVLYMSLWYIPQAPDYFSVVKVPMDLLTIKNKIKRYEYIHPTAILEDVRLVFRNCQQYNMPTAAEYIAGQKLSKYFEKQVRDLKLNTLAEQVKSPKKAATNQAETSPTSKRATRHK